MPNTSATGGYLQPTVPTPPEEGSELDAILQAAVVGVTALPGDLVRPRWQPNPPKMPERDTDWCAIGVHEERPDAGPAIKHNPTGGPAGQGSDTVQRHELIEVLASFYGPLGQRYAAMFRDGLSLPQNMEALELRGLYFHDMLPIMSVPEQHNQLWFKRYDLRVFFKRKVEREYAIENLLAARIKLVTDTTPQIERDINVTQ